MNGTLRTPPNRPPPKGGERKRPVEGRDGQKKNGKHLEAMKRRII